MCFSFILLSFPCAPPPPPKQAYLTVTDSFGASTTSNKVSINALACSSPPVAKLSGGALSMSCGGTTKLDGKFGCVGHLQAGWLWMCGSGTTCLCQALRLTLC